MLGVSQSMIQSHKLSRNYTQFRIKVILFLLERAMSEKILFPEGFAFYTFIMLSVLNLLKYSTEEVDTVNSQKCVLIQGALCRPVIFFNLLVLSKLNIYYSNKYSFLSLYKYISLPLYVYDTSLIFVSDRMKQFPLHNYLTHYILTST